jgi:hypothetical protein
LYSVMQKDLCNTIGAKQTYEGALATIWQSDARRPSSEHRRIKRKLRLAID